MAAQTVKAQAFEQRKAVQNASRAGRIAIVRVAGSEREGFRLALRMQVQS